MLLVLLVFFFVLALAFTIWAALTVGDAAKRTQEARAHAQERAGRPRDPVRERKPWERVPEPAPAKAERLRRRRKRRDRNDTGGADAGRPQAAAKPWERRQDVAVQGTLWENKPATKGKDVVKPRAQSEADDRGGRAVVTPRKPNTDAFERFLDSEKRRD